MYYIPYRKNLKEFSRTLRNNSTLSEVLLWNRLKGKVLYGYGFNRQKPLGNYIVDFYCKELKLVVEIDGISHKYEDAYLSDQKRQKVLENFDLNFIRFHDMDVKRNIENVLRTIEAYIVDFENEKI